MSEGEKETVTETEKECNRESSDGHTHTYLYQATSLIRNKKWKMRKKMLIERCQNDIESQ